MNIVFFGSFQHYSTLVLKDLVEHQDIEVLGVITTPPMPVGRKKVLTKTHTHQWAEEKHLPVHTPVTLDEIELKKIKDADFFVTAGYGKLLPPNWLAYPKFGSLNLHFSLLPKYRGANPAEWALLLGETKTGVTLIEMAEEFDTGAIIAKKDIPITATDTRETIYEKLYNLGASELPDWLIRHYNWLQKKYFFCQQTLSPDVQPDESPTPDARRFTRAQGYIPWEIIESAMNGKPYDSSGLSSHLRTAYNFLFANNPTRPEHAEGLPDQLNFIERASRALAGFPTVWTYIPTTKGKQRMKIFSFTLSPKPYTLSPNLVQLEGQSPALFNQIKNQLVTGINPGA